MVLLNRNLLVWSLRTCPFSGYHWLRHQLIVSGFAISCVFLSIFVVSKQWSLSVAEQNKAAYAARIDRIILLSLITLSFQIQFAQPVNRAVDDSICRLVVLKLDCASNGDNISSSDRSKISKCLPTVIVSNNRTYRHLSSRQPTNNMNSSVWCQWYGLQRAVRELI